MNTVDLLLPSKTSSLPSLVAKGPKIFQSKCLCLLFQRTNCTVLLILLKRKEQWNFPLQNIQLIERAEILTNKKIWKLKVKIKKILQILVNTKLFENVNLIFYWWVWKSWQDFITLMQGGKCPKSPMPKLTLFSYLCHLEGFC